MSQNTYNPVTIQYLEQQAIDGMRDELEWQEGMPRPDDERLNELIDVTAGDTVPAMTTVLFGLVVHDNSLAFEDTDVMSSEPFAVLHAAVKQRIERALDQWVESAWPTP